MSAIPLNRPKIQTFGGLRILGCERMVSQFSQRRSALLLARLALARGRTVSREVLAELLWPGEGTDRTLQRLRQALVGLRDAMNRAEPGLAIAIRSERLTLALDLGAVDLDLVLFEHDLRHAQATQDSGAYKAALAHAEGELLEDYHTDWIDAERRIMRTQIRDAALELASLLNVGQDPNAIRLLQLLLHRDPLDERLMSALLVCAKGSGLESDVMRTYAEFERQIQRQLGIAPSVSLRNLAESVRRAQNTTRIEVPVHRVSHEELPIADWALIPGTFTRETAAVACNRIDAFALLARAVELGWIEVATADPTPRYRVKLAPQGRETDRDTKGRLVAHTIRLLEEANHPGLRGLRGIWGERLAEETPLIVAAFQWSKESGDHELAARVAMTSRRALVYAGKLGEAKQMASEALRSGTIEDSLRADLLIHRARLHLSGGDLERCAADLRESQVPGASLSPATRAAWCYAMALLAHGRGLKRAEGRFARESAEWYEEAGMPVEGLDALMVLGLNLQHRGRVAQARAAFREAFARADALGDDLGVGIALHHQAHLAAEEGDYAEAQRLLEAALRVCTLSGDALGEAWARRSLAIRASLDDHADAAHEHIRHALVLVHRHRDTSGHVSCLEIDALIHWRAERHPEALLGLAKAAEAAQQANLDLALGELALWAAAVLVELDDLPSAARALGIGRRLGARTLPRHTGFHRRGEAALQRLEALLDRSDVASELDKGAQVPRRLIPEEIRSLGECLH